MKYPSLQALRVFETAARHQSFANAADELCVTRSAVSHQIQNLEGQMGVKLFERHTRSVSLTSAGETLLPMISQAFSNIETATASVSKNELYGSKVLSERLSIIVPPGFAPLWLGKRLHKFIAQNPSIELDIRTSVDATDVLHRRAHLAVNWSLDAWPELLEERLFQFTEFPVCSPMLLKNGPPLKKPEDLLNYPLLHNESFAWWTLWLNAADVDTSNLAGHVFANLSLTTDVARSGLGIALAGSVLMADMLLSGELVKPLGVVRFSETQFRLLTDPGAAANQPVQRFKQWLRSEVEATVQATEILRENCSFYSTKHSVNE